MSYSFATHRKNAQAALRARRGEMAVTRLSQVQAGLLNCLTERELEELALAGTGKS